LHRTSKRPDTHLEASRLDKLQAQIRPRIAAVCCPV